jgi:hypothetical protein
MGRSRRNDGARLIGDGEWITIAQAADRLGLSPSEVRRRVDDRGVTTTVDPRAGVTIIARRELHELAGEATGTTIPHGAAAPLPPPLGQGKKRTGSRQGTRRIEGTLESRRAAWFLAADEGTWMVEVDHPAPSRLVGKKRQWIITYRGKRLPRLTPSDLGGRRANGVRRSVWTVSGGLPGLGKRR